MYYQLPTGKVIQITIDELLSLSDKDIQYYISANAGEYISNPWSGSAINEHEEIDSEDENLDDQYLETYFDDLEDQEEDKDISMFDFDE